MTNPPFLPSVAGLELLDVIAHGGHSTVYRARQPGHGQIVAVKVNNTRIVDEVAMRRFDRERTALGTVSSHPGVVGLIDSGFTDEGMPYLVLDFAPGGSLADRLASGPLDGDEATRLGVSIAGVLEHAHRSGVLHRDIKPENIVRSADGEWLVTDFSVAGFTDGRSTTETVQLSFAHSPPEAFGDHEPAPTGDVYSLASVLFTAMTATEPFAVQDGEGTNRAIERILNEPVPDGRRSGVPDELAQLLEAAMSKDPRRRPPTARAFGMALNEVRSTLGAESVPLQVGVDDAGEATRVVEGEQAAFDPEPVAVPDRHRLRTAVLGAAAAATLVLGGATLIGRSSAGPTTAAPAERDADATAGADDAPSDDPAGDTDSGAATTDGTPDDGSGGTVDSADETQPADDQPADDRAADDLAADDLAADDLASADTEVGTDAATGDEPDEEVTPLLADAVEVAAGNAGNGNGPGGGAGGGGNGGGNGGGGDGGGDGPGDGGGNGGGGNGGGGDGDGGGDGGGPGDGGGNGGGGRGGGPGGRGNGGGPGGGGNGGGGDGGNGGDGGGNGG